MATKFYFLFLDVELMCHSLVCLLFTEWLVWEAYNSQESLWCSQAHPNIAAVFLALSVSETAENGTQEATLWRLLLWKLRTHSDLVRWFMVCFYMPAAQTFPHHNQRTYVTLFAINKRLNNNYTFPLTHRTLAISPEWSLNANADMD